MQNSEYRRIGDLREINSDKRRISAKNINSDKHPPIFKKNKHRKHGALVITDKGLVLFSNISYS